MQEKPFVWDSKMKHKIELMIILLIITVIGNIAVYYFNHKYEKGGSYAKSEEVVKEPIPSEMLELLRQIEQKEAD
jgi:ABC-type cobalt transport system substrate-binding protein